MNIVLLKLAKFLISVILPRIYEALPELGGAPIIMSDVGPGGIVNGTHPNLSYIRCSIYDSADSISHI